MKIKLVVVGLALVTAALYLGCENPVEKSSIEKSPAGNNTEVAAKHHTIEITKENFDELVRNSEVPVLVDFWAPWCGPCVALTPTIEELAEAYDGKVVVGKINTDEQPELAQEFGIQTIPALHFFKDGEMVKTSNARSLDELKADADEIIEL